jgi:hypothetical protein
MEAQGHCNVPWAAMLEFATLLPVLRTRNLAQDERLRTPPVIFASTPDDQS